MNDDVCFYYDLSHGDGQQYSTTYTSDSSGVRTPSVNIDDV